MITPARGLPAGRAFTVVVHYAGVPVVVTDPDESTSATRRTWSSPTASTASWPP